MKKIIRDIMKIKELNFKTSDKIILNNISNNSKKEISKFKDKKIKKKKN